MAARRLDKAFYRQDAETVARGLIGQRFVHHVGDHRLAGIIVETEAYLGIVDAASHAYRARRTTRTEVMYQDGGTVYVFLNYGIHYLFNIVVGNEDDPQAVLVRAAEPVEGLEVIQSLRPKAKKVEDLCSGPGKFGAAFAIHLDHNGIDLTESSTMYVEADASVRPQEIVAATRIGVDYAGEWAQKPLRFFLRHSKHVSVLPASDR